MTHAAADHMAGPSAGPAAGPDGGTSRARYSLDEALASKIAGQAADLLTRFPLYPSVHLD